jgi:hypothetical protein
MKFSIAVGTKIFKDRYTKRIIDEPQEDIIGLQKIEKRCYT